MHLFIYFIFSSHTEQGLKRSEQQPFLDLYLRTGGSAAPAGPGATIGGDVTSPMVGATSSSRFADTATSIVKSLADASSRTKMFTLNRTKP